MSLTSHLEILVGYDNGESANAHCKIQTPQLKTPNLKITNYAKIHSKNPNLKIHQVQFSNKEPFRCAYSLMKASFSILAHASSGLGARICEKKTNI
jgi:hypothetical protein